jgi:hypothetical protein
MSAQCIRVLGVEQVFAAAPRPLLREVAEAGRDRVGKHVRDRVSEVVVVEDNRRGEAVAEEVAVPVVPAVELLRVRAVHALHPGRERREHAVDDEVEVRVEQAPRDHPPLPLDDLAGEESEQEEPVLIVADDRGRVHAEDRHVERAGWRG